MRWPRGGGRDLTPGDLTPTTCGRRDTARLPRLAESPRAAGRRLAAPAGEGADPIGGARRRWNRSTRFTSRKTSRDTADRGSRQAGRGDPLFLPARRGSQGRDISQDPTAPVPGDDIDDERRELRRCVDVALAELRDYGADAGAPAREGPHTGQIARVLHLPRRRSVIRWCTRAPSFGNGCSRVAADRCGRH